jgi:hypothetical protein
MVSIWTIQDGPYWRSRAAMLRRTADETDALRIARGYDVLAKRVEQNGATRRTPQIDRQASQSVSRRRGRPSRSSSRSVSQPLSSARQL